MLDRYRYLKKSKQEEGQSNILRITCWGIMYTIQRGEFLCNLITPTLLPSPSPYPTKPCLLNPKKTLHIFEMTVISINKYLKCRRCSYLAHFTYTFFDTSPHFFDFTRSTRNAYLSLNT